MTGRLKSLGLLLAAVFAMSALAASSALAAEFHSAAAPATISGNQSTSHVFTTSAGTFTCKVATFSGTTASKTASSQTLTPKYESCTAFGFLNVPVVINGCGYVFQASGVTEIECPAGKAIEIAWPGCTTKIKEQKPAGSLEYTTVGTTPNRDIRVHTSLSGIAYDECGTARTNGSYKGTTTVVGSAGEVWYA